MQDYAVIKRMREQGLRVSEERRKDCTDKTFRLVGSVNLFGNLPALVLPIFICEQDKDKNKYYTQDGEYETAVLNSFIPFVKEDVYPVVLFENNKFESEIFTIDSNPIFVFQLSKKEYVIEHAKEMKNFLRNFTTEDEILKDQIQDFLENVKLPED